MKMRDILNQEIDTACLGCAIGVSAVTPPGGIICTTKHFVLHQDPVIPIDGFLIVAARTHLRSITDFDETARRELVELIYQGVAALKALDIAQEVTLIQEDRSGHFHVWLFPWHAWMDEAGFNHSVANTRAVIAYAKEKRNTPAEVARVLAAVEKVSDYLNAVH